jgi:hypothetical protein
MHATTLGAPGAATGRFDSSTGQPLLTRAGDIAHRAEAQIRTHPGVSLAVTALAGMGLAALTLFFAGRRDRNYGWRA